MRKMNLSAKKVLFIVAAMLLVLVALVMLAWGIPAVNNLDISLARSALFCNLSNNLEILPRRSITNASQMKSLAAGLRSAKCRLMLPTLEGIRGPVVFLDSEGRAFTAFLYNEAAQGLIEYETTTVGQTLRLGSMKTTGALHFAKVIRFDIFEAANQMHASPVSVGMARNVE
jgi:hypothetical protein